MLEQNAIMRYIRIFSELSGQMRYAVAKRILLEMPLIKVCRPSMETKQDSLLERIRDLEDKIENGVPLLAASNSSSAQPAGQEAFVKKERPPLPNAIPEDVKTIVSKWSVIVNQTASPMKLYLKNAKLSLGGDNRLMVVLEDGLASDYFTQHQENKEYLENLLSEHAGKEIQVTIQAISKNENFDNSYVDLSKVIQMEIEEED